MKSNLVTLVAVGLAMVALSGGLAAQPETKMQTEFMTCAEPYGASGWIVLRFERYSGQTWQMQDGNWHVLPEAEPISPGNYTVHLVSSGQEKQDTWYAVRTESNTGKSSLLSDGKWSPIRTVADE